MRIDNYEAMKKMRDGQVYEDGSGCLAFYMHGRYLWQSKNGKVQFLLSGFSYEEWQPSTKVPELLRYQYKDVDLPIWWDGRPVWGEFWSNDDNEKEKGWLIGIRYDYSSSYICDFVCYKNFRPLLKEKKKDYTITATQEQWQKIQEILK